MKIDRRAFWLLAAMLGAGGRAQESPVVPDGERAALQAVEQRVSELRKLAFVREVPVATAGRAALREYAERRLQQFSSPQSEDAEETAYALLGLVPAGTSFLESYTALVEDAAGGYYDPESGKYFIVAGLPPGAGPILAAHELTHALEDQHYDLDARIESARENADLEFAVMAVHEGSASLLMAVYVAEGLRNHWLERADLEALIHAEESRSEALATAPDFLRRPLLGAYVLGTWFLTRGGPQTPGLAGYPAADVDRTYADGPKSSEQILHPEKYWDPAQRDEPRTVRLPDAAPLLGPGWKREASGVLGELLLGPLVGAPTPGTWDERSVHGQGWTNAAATGWGGDRWELWRSGERAVVLLVTAWDSARDAREFFAALPARASLAARRDGDRVVVIGGALEGLPVAKLARALARAPR